VGELKRKAALILLFAGIGVFVLGFFVTFFYMEGGPEQRWHVVKAGSTFELSWYLQRGDRTRVSFNATGEIRFTVKNPSGVAIVLTPTLYTGSGGFLNCTFTAEESGMHSMIFENPDSLNDKPIYVDFRSPLEPRVTIYDVVGSFMMLGGAVGLLFGVYKLATAAQDTT
jgi:hypothetical protein